MPTDYYLVIFLEWLARVHHANIRTNFGPLRHLLVPPQFHRVPHSIHPRHVDRNFAGVVTFWDRLFGTYWSDSDDYPDTGIDDDRFPFEQRTKGVVRNWLAQNAYPFVQVL